MTHRPHGLGTSAVGADAPLPVAGGVVAVGQQQDVAGLVSVVGKVQVNIGCVKDSAYRTMYFRVPAEEERL